MDIRLVIFGAGGLGREVLWAARRMTELLAENPLNILGFFDDTPDAIGREIHGVPVLGAASSELLGTLSSRPTHYICAIGNNEARRQICARMDALDLQPATVIDPSVILGPGVRIGPGCYVGAGCILSPDSTLGSHVVVNHSSTIGHDAKVGDFAQICPGGRLSGWALVEEGALVGTNAVLAPKAVLGAWATLGAASMVNRQVPPHATALGVPAKIIFTKPTPPSTSAE